MEEAEAKPEPKEEQAKPTAGSSPKDIRAGLTVVSKKLLGSNLLRKCSYRQIDFAMAEGVLDHANPTDLDTNCRRCWFQIEKNPHEGQELGQAKSTGPWIGLGQARQSAAMKDGERGRNRIRKETYFQGPTGRQMTRKSLKSTLNRVNSTQTARRIIEDAISDDGSQTIWCPKENQPRHVVGSGVSFPRVRRW